jgi:hypothetical protein
MRLQEAMADVRYIYACLDRDRRANCYRAVTILGSGLIAVVAALLQDWILVGISGSSASPVPFFTYWTAAAFLSVSLIGAEIGFRYACRSTARIRQQTRDSIGELLPSVVIAALISILVVAHAPQHGPMLPGIWACLFSLGIWSSRQRLPTLASWVALHYLTTGLVCIRFANAEHAYAPWTMLITFGLGQILTAGILYGHEKKCFDHPGVDDGQES